MHWRDSEYRQPLDLVLLSCSSVQSHLSLLSTLIIYTVCALLVGGYWRKFGNLFNTVGLPAMANMMTNDNDSSESRVTYDLYVTLRGKEINESELMVYCAWKAGSLRSSISYINLQDLIVVNFPELSASMMLYNQLKLKMLSTLPAGTKQSCLQ